jgi:hypothetical protein
MDAAILGTGITELAETMANLFKLAENWNAVTLLDEADVFLERRSASDLERGRLVAGASLRFLH